MLRKDVYKSQLNLTVRDELEAILEMEDFRDSINQVHRVSFPLLISFIINAIFRLSFILLEKIKKETVSEVNGFVFSDEEKQ